MDLQKKQMQEAAVLYYEKKLTQSDIAQIMGLSRQTVSKLLTEAVKENIVEITIHDPDVTCTDLEDGLCRKYNIKNAIVCGVSCNDGELCRLMTVKRAEGYILSLIKSGNKKIGISWGRTVQMLIDGLEGDDTSNNVVFPLFGATDQEQSRYLSNELARSFADKINGDIKYAWFPYRPDSTEDCELFKKTSYYKKLADLWKDIDVALVGIGNNEIIRTFGRLFGYNENSSNAVGDIATHFFNADGGFVDMYENTLCASVDDLKKAKETVAVACGSDKAEAISGALKTGVVDTLITDEYTAKKVLDF